MEIIIKGRHGIKVADDLKAYIEEKVGAVINDLGEPTVCEVILTDENGKRGGEDKEIHISCTVPHIKYPVYVDIKTEDFYKSVDLVADKFRRALHNAKR